LHVSAIFKPEYCCDELKLILVISFTYKLILMFSSFMRFVGDLDLNSVGVGSHWWCQEWS